MATSLKRLLLAIPGIQYAGIARSELEARWFDWRHQIRTTGDVQPHQMQIAGNNSQYGRKYNPTSLRTGKRVFADLPIQDFSQYTFIDYGSGKGRMLFLAAERPFRRVLGVEYASDLHAIAEQNIRSYRNPRQQCFQIESLNVDATEFDPPRENTVAYFFSPFNRPLMEPLIQRLDDSIQACPRDFFIVYLNPELSDIIENTRHFRIISKTRYYTIYRT
jgi:16S rRNA G966 N2-methylase RsmD